MVAGSGSEPERGSIATAWAIVRTAGEEFVADSGLRLAAALSYYTVFSLVPLLLLVLAVAGFVFDDPTITRDVVREVVDVAGQEVGDVINTLLTRVASQRGGTLSIGVVLAAFFASGIFQQVQTVLGGIFHIPKEERRTGAVGWVVRRAIGIVSAVVLAILVFTPIAAVAAIDGLVALLPGAAAWLEPVLRIGVPIVSLLMLMAVVGVTFQALTAIGIPWKAAVRGGATTALIGLSAAFLVGLYLTRAGATGTLGVLGGIAILLLFFNLMWAVFVYGAEVTKVYADYLLHGDVRRPETRHATPSPAAAVSGAGDGEIRAGLWGFLVGAVLGWSARGRK